MFHPELQKNLKHNFTVNVLDGAFFGFGLGFASMVTVVPLFMDTLTDSTALIGMVSSIQIIGWNLPQILTAHWVAGLKRYLPMVMWMTVHERWPFFGMALVALLVSQLGANIAVALTFLMVCLFALGGGLTATAWQTMIGKIMPVNRRGAFWGTQSAAASVCTAIGALLGGVLLEEVAYPYNYAISFFIAGVAMMISMAFIGFTREPEVEVNQAVKERKVSLEHYKSILRNDINLQFFIAARFMAQIGLMAVAYFTIYGKRELSINEAFAGTLLASMTITQTVAGPLVGWLGDRFGNRRVFAGGAVVMAVAIMVALSAQSANWLYAVFILAGCAHSAFWTVAMSMTLEFSSEAERPYYIGLVNTMIAPASLIAPLIGGLLADTLGFGATFTLAAVACLITAALLAFLVRDPQAYNPAVPVSVVAAHQVGD